MILYKYVNNKYIVSFVYYIVLSIFVCAVDNQLKTEWETDVKELFEEHSGYADDAMCVNNDGHDGRNGNAVADGNPLMLW